MPKPFKFFSLCLLSVFLNTSLSESSVTLPAVFSDHMVLLQKSEIIMWGWAKPTEEVTVIGSWDSKPIQAATDNHASWTVKLNTPAAGGPYTVTVCGANTIVIQDVLVGELWLCSGQSNMEWSARAGIDNAAQEIFNANYFAIRFFQVAKRSADAPQLDCAGKWMVCTPETMIDFSAIGYFFGRNLYDALSMPVGLINSSWGATPAESWINPKIVAENEEFSQAALKIPVMRWCPEKPGKAYNGMIAPLIPFQIAGVIWYQGETNAQNPEIYSKLFPALIQNWRTEWKKDFPFYYVQIAPYKGYQGCAGVLVREAQLKSMSVPNTGMVVVNDIGNIENIHPSNKQDVGKRLANWALAKTYGKEGIPFSGPIYRDMKAEGNKIRIFFDYADHGLMCKGKKLTYFQIAGEDGVFADADAKIDGGTVIVYAKEVKKPVAVRFAWSDTAEPNLFNTEGLPASCFRTDNWEMTAK